MSMPNPLMLPFMEAGGAVSGANFGLFYTVLMQLGYNHFAKKAQKEIEQGMPLTAVLMNIQKEMHPFNEKIMQMAFDNMDTVLKKMVEYPAELFSGQAFDRAHGVTTSEDNFKAISDSISGFFKSISNPIPQAYGDAGETLTTSAFNDYFANLRGNADEQQGPTTNVNQFVSMITSWDKVKLLQSQEKYSGWQRELITKEIKRRNAHVTKVEQPTANPNPSFSEGKTQAYIDYITERNKKYSQIVVFVNQSVRPARGASYNTMLRAMDNRIADFKSWIRLQRNSSDAMVKSQATKDEKKSWRPTHSRT
jgi:hypothetical protein